jgi:hypothetical protein
MPLLYKFLSPKDASRFLNSRRFIASDPRRFNDPFEVRPMFDRDLYDFYVSQRSNFYARVLTPPNVITVGFDHWKGNPEDFEGLADTLNAQFRNELGERFRVLCLSETPLSALMWGHYGQCHRGLVVGIEVSSPEFPTGIAAAGFPIQYEPDRVKIPLPRAYYDFPPVHYGRRDVISDGGLQIPYEEYKRQLGAAQLAALRIKSEDWSYEKEVRFIYDLTQHTESLWKVGSRCFVRIAKQIIREVYIGFDAPIELVERLQAKFLAGWFGEATCYYTACHPRAYEIMPLKILPSFLSERWRKYRFD